MYYYSYFTMKKLKESKQHAKDPTTSKWQEKGAGIGAFKP